MYQNFSAGKIFGPCQTCVSGSVRANQAMLDLTMLDDYNDQALHCELLQEPEASSMRMLLLFGPGFLPAK